MVCLNQVHDATFRILQKLAYDDLLAHAIGLPHDIIKAFEGQAAAICFEPAPEK